MSAKNKRTIRFLLLLCFVILSLSVVLPRNHNIVLQPGISPGVPHQLPGPMDQWSEGQQKEIKMNAPFRAETVLSLALMESHEINSPLLYVLVNNKQAGEIAVMPGNGKPYYLWATDGKQSNYKLRIPSSFFDARDNTIVIKAVSGSWVGIDNITLTRIPFDWELWHRIPNPLNFVLFWVIVLGFPFFMAFKAYIRDRQWELKPVAFGYMMMSVIGLSLVLMLAGVTTYIEIMTPWIVENSGRPERAFFSKRFVADADLGWKSIPNYTAYVRDPQGREISTFYATNKYGFRSLEEEREFPGSGAAIVLGDSFVQGIYLAQYETIPYHLSKSLNDYVYNFGVAGYSTDQQYTVFKKWIERVKVKWVILVFYANDLLYLDIQKAQKSHKPKYEIRDNVVDFDKLHPLVVLATGHSWNKEVGKPETNDLFCCFTERKSHLFGRILSRFTSYVWNIPFPSEVISNLMHDVRFTKININEQNLEVQNDYFHSPDKFDGKLDLAFQFYNEMKRQTEQHGAKFLLVYMPDVREVVNHSNKKMSLLANRFIKLCSDNDISCIDPTDKLAQKQKFESMYFLDDGHISPAGSNQLAKIISREMRSID